jgi:murein DD-endopeptidase MepM/ murein hydrolase activator NlpD
LPARDKNELTRRAFRGVPRSLAALGFLSLFLVAPPAPADETAAPVASAFVFPIGDELDFTKAAPGEPSGYHVSDPYLAIRKARRHRAQRVHYGTDFSAGQGGLTVRAIAAGVVDVSDGNALVKVRKAQRIKLPAVVNGKRGYRWGTRYRTAWKWRTGWGNRVVIRHMLPNGQVVYSLYAHLMPRSVIVHAGDVVSAGQPIARVGRTGRATAPHLHLEIRTTRIDESDAVSGPDAESEEESDPGEGSETANPHTVDPVTFLASHVLKCEDLQAGTWEARYALAAVKDGVMGADRDHFEPDDEVTRGDFYAALVTTFHLGTPFTKDRFDSNLDALVDTGIVDASTRSRLDEHDRVNRSEALELVLRCLDRGSARAQSMGKIPAEQLARDFNVEFAGRDAARDADVEARKLAANETETLRSAARVREDRRIQAARERGAPPPKRRRIKIEAVKPMPLLDPGFQSLAQSKKNLSRAEACLLLTSALRLGSSNLSALERAATRASKTG